MKTHPNIKNNLILKMGLILKQIKYNKLKYNKSNTTKSNNINSNEIKLEFHGPFAYLLTWPSPMGGPWRSMARVGCSGSSMARLHIKTDQNI